MLTKAEQMDERIKSEKRVTVSSVEHIVFDIFGISLRSIAADPKAPGAQRTHPLFKEWAGDEGGKAGKEELLAYAFARLPAGFSGEMVREVINDVYRVNLSGISALEASLFSLFSKGKWVKQDEYDLFVLNTGSTDTEVTVSVTDHFIRQTGSSVLPAGLYKDLEALGYFYVPEKNQLKYLSPSGCPVGDAFKKQTIEALEKAGQQIQM
ncbi:hypothetical protein CHL76_02070 [Marinococcus halophilus]|uniref:Uncharacterized protein n=1 Tax=Marinococcus halophilus TaxID=1371 RepID=A0A510YA09_MARHA|nr:hypothetical protein [Marinococcus halophilus]OZT81902.1 hypothetical protein CHL76_02070 [Marinococcus halophilus]GEK59227.1 hypothetical protein MHA01_21320 [Marinococcus halophilus]